MHRGEELRKGKGSEGTENEEKERESEREREGLFSGHALIDELGVCSQLLMLCFVLYSPITILSRWGLDSS